MGPQGCSQHCHSKSFSTLTAKFLLDVVSFFLLLLSEPGRGYPTKLYKGKLHPEVLTLTLLYAVFDSKATPFMLPISHMLSSHSVIPCLSAWIA